MTKVMSYDNICAAVCLAVASLSAGPSVALEGIAATGPIGGSDIRSALLPPPGLYGGLVGVSTPMGDLNLPSGAIPGSGSAWIAGGGLLYVYDAKLLGGSLASSLFAGYQQSCYGVKAAGVQPCATGLLDSWSDLLLWSFFFPIQSPANKQGGVLPIPYGLAVQFGIGASFPTGDYSATRSVNVGSNFYDIAPNIAITYTMPNIFGQFLGQATEISVRGFYNYYTTNTTTNYQTSPILSVDFALTQRWDSWQFGVAGTAYTQIGHDKVNGVTITPDRTASLIGIGPLVSYDFIAAERPWSVTFKALFGVEASNIPAIDAYSLRIATKFF